MSAKEVDDWTSELQGKIDVANSWQKTDWETAKNTIISQIGNIKDGFATLGDDISKMGTRLSTQDLRGELATKGFDLAADRMEDMSKEDLQKIEQYVGREGSDEALSNLGRLAQQSGISSDVLSKQQYYLHIFEKYEERGDFSGLSTEKTYEEYLSDKASRAQNLIDQLRTRLVQAYVSNQEATTNDLLGFWMESGFSRQVFEEWEKKIWNELSRVSGGGRTNLVNSTMDEMLEQAFLQLGVSRYSTGGLADFTGPAWLDGTKSRPELVLNQRDTANFIQLKDILAEVMNRSTITDTKSKPSGDNYFEIAINVDSIESDYDVEQIADKIRDMIYQDATYRNVNAINWKK